MKILHVADYLMPQMGYQEFVLAKWNARHDHDVHIVTSDRYRPVPDYDRTWGRLLGPRFIGAGVNVTQGVTVHRLSVRLEIKRRVWLAGLRQKIEDIDPEIVFCHGTSSPLAFALPSISRRLGVPLLMDGHMVFVNQRRGALGRAYYAVLKTLTERRLVGSVHKFLGVAQEACDFMERELAIPAEKILRLDLGVDTDLFQSDPEAGKRARVEHGIPADAKVVMQTGKLTRDKGPQLLSDAMTEIMTKDPTVWLVFVGAAPQEDIESITNPIVRASAGERLKFVDFVPVDELGKIFNMADVCVFPGGSSLSAVEAASCGRPVIVTDHDWGLSRQQAGIATCYRAGDTSDLRAKIDSLLADPITGRSLGRQAQKAAAELYSYDSVARTAEAVMEEAILAYA